MRLASITNYEQFKLELIKRQIISITNNRKNNNIKMDTQQQYTYYAFISYQRKDEKWAKWLQRKLESYKLPVLV